MAAYEDNCYDAPKAGVLSQTRSTKSVLKGFQPMPAVFDQRFVTRIDGPNVKKGSNDLAEGLIEDIRT